MLMSMVIRSKDLLQELSETTLREQEGEKERRKKITFRLTGEGSRRKLLPILDSPRIALEKGEGGLPSILPKRLGYLALSLALCCCSIIPSIEAKIPEKKAVRAILGEARGEGFVGMLAVASAIRNRGTLEGVYGDFEVDSHTEPLVRLARQAWAISCNYDGVRGADHWENVRTFGLPYWAKGRKPVIVVKNHQFFKLNKRTRREGKCASLNNDYYRTIDSGMVSGFTLHNIHDLQMGSE